MVRKQPILYMRLSGLVAMFECQNSQKTRSNLISSQQGSYNFVFHKKEDVMYGLNMPYIDMHVHQSQHIYM